MDLSSHITSLKKANATEATVTVKITPSSPKNECTGLMSDGTIKIRIHAAPEHGKANAELINFLSKSLDIPHENIAIVSGHTQSRKRIRIAL